MATGGWYVITFRAKPTDPFTVRVSQKPFPAGQSLIDSGPYATQLEAAAAAAKLRTALIPHVPTPPTPTSPFTPIASVGDFFHRLTEKETWIRVGEVALGGILVYAGVRALSSGTAVSSAAKSVTKPAKKATKTVVKTAVTKKPSTPRPPTQRKVPVKS
jgi:hypothetical protein